MPANLKPHAEAAKARHKKRHTQPGVIVELEKDAKRGQRLASPHRDQDAWEAMICDSLGTRSVATAETFLRTLTKLCDEVWHSDGEGDGERVPDEMQLNMVLNMVGSIKPRNEMEAALAAQMVAVHLMTMKTAEAALSSGWGTDPRFASITGKLARTFAIQMDTLKRGRGERRNSKQTIIVRQERHVHHHQHVHVQQQGGGSDDGPQTPCNDARAVELCASSEVPSNRQDGGALPRPSGEGLEGLPHARSKGRDLPE
jgi:hypothetical protein